MVLRESISKSPAAPKRLVCILERTTISAHLTSLDMGISDSRTIESRLRSCETVNEFFGDPKRKTMTFQIEREACVHLGRAMKIGRVDCSWEMMMKNNGAHFHIVKGSEHVRGGREAWYKRSFKAKKLIQNIGESNLRVIVGANFEHFWNVRLPALNVGTNARSEVSASRSPQGRTTGEPERQAGVMRRAEPEEVIDRIRGDKRPRSYDVQFQKAVSSACNYRRCVVISGTHQYAGVLPVFKLSIERARFPDCNSESLQHISNPNI